MVRHSGGIKEQKAELQQDRINKQFVEPEASKQQDNLTVGHSRTQANACKYFATGQLGSEPKTDTPNTITTAKTNGQNLQPPAPPPDASSICQSSSLWPAPQPSVSDSR